MSPEDYDMVVDKSAFAKWALFTRAPLVVQENAIRAYFDPKGAQIWPNVNVKVLWCDSGSWGMILGAKWLADRISEWRNGMRKVELVRLEDANHFVSHWYLCVCGNDFVEDRGPDIDALGRTGEVYACVDESLDIVQALQSFIGFRRSYLKFRPL